ncbi:putative cadmium-transporting ATPase [subsurface metagenome]
MAHSDTAVAIETADIVLASNDLGVLPYLFVLSTQTRNTIKINIAVSLIIKLVFFILVFFDITQLWMAVLFGDMGASLLVILNAMRVGRQKIFLS